MSRVKVLFNELALVARLERLKEFAANFVSKYHVPNKELSGIITPVRAQDTGLVPNYCTVESDNLEGDINLANLDYSFCPLREGEDGWVEIDTILERVGVAYGSLGFAAALLKAQEQGKEIFPVESRGKHYFIMPRTVLNDLLLHHRKLAYFHWFSERWVLDFYWIGYDSRNGARFVLPRE